jgi:preprotein translocase subunit SecE
MNAENRKWVLGGFIAIAMLVGYILMQTLFKLAGIWDLEARVKSIDLVIQIGSLLVAFGVFFFLTKHEKSNQFTTEVVTELSRVTWPTQKETTSATMIVIVMVIVTGVILGLLDYVWARLIQLVL